MFRRKAASMPWDWVLFAGAVFVACCCLHIGLSGKYSDDYSITMRNFATGEIDWSLNPWAERYPYFWRPLHLALLWGVGTAFWNHDWVAHVLSALAHGGCALMLGVWLKSMGLSTRVSVIAGLMFMSHTLHAEAINWFSTICVSLGALTMLWVLELGRSASARGNSAGFGRTLAMATLSFGAACWYESSAAALLALPLAMIAARPREERLGAAVRRAIVPTAACGLVCVLYAALLVGTAPSWQRGSAARMAGGHEFVSRCAWIVGQWGEWLFGPRGRDLWVGAWIEGKAWMMRPLGVVIAAVLVAAAVGAMWAWWREGVREKESGAQAGRLCHASGGLGWLVIAGAAMFFGAWLPVLAVKDNSIELRTWYTPLVGVVVVIACVIEAVTRALATRGVFGRAVHGAMGVVAIAVVLAGTLAQIGWQSVFVRVWEHDEKRAAQIVAAVPNPPKDAVIMPLFTRAREAATGRKFFDFAVEGGLSQSWSCWAMMQRAYKRRDITATHLSARTPEERPLREFSERGVWSVVNLAGDFERSKRPEGGSFVPWDRAVPVSLQAEGNVEFVERLEVLRPRSEDLKVELGLDKYQEFVRRQDKAARMRLRDPDANWGKRLSKWMERGADGTARPITIDRHRPLWPELQLVAHLDKRNQAVWIDVPPSKRNRVVALRCAKLEPDEHEKGCLGTEYRVRIALSDAQGQPQGADWRDAFFRSWSEQRLEVTIPANAKATRLWCELYQVAKGEYECEGSVTLDPGWLIDLPEPPDLPGKATAPGGAGPEYTPPTRKGTLEPDSGTTEDSRE